MQQNRTPRTDPGDGPGAARASDADSLRAVCDQVGAMRRFARHRVRDEALAEDAVQDALEAALVALPGFQAQSSLRTWLFGILTHKIQDAFRREARYVRLSGLGDADAPSSGEASEVTHAVDLPDPDESASDPLRRVARRRFVDAVSIAVDALPASLREVFVRQAVDGLSTPAVCRDLGISEANCWVRLHRARRRLSGALRDHY